MEKRILKYFFFFLFVFLVVFNWQRISFLFNPHIVFLLIKSPFEKFFSQKAPLSLPQLEKETEKTPFPCKKTEKENTIEIEKLGIVAPLVLVENEKQIEKGLEKGVVIFPGSSLPHEKGLTVILGHSAPPRWPKVRYEWVFSKIGQMEIGDTIKLNFQGCEYTFSVKEKKIFKKGEELPNSWLKTDGVALISCWPPGKNLKRIGILAEKIF